MPHKASNARSAETGRQDALRRFKAEIFRVLAHPTRIHVVESLRDGDLSVGELLERIPVEPANLSQHLGVLRSKGLVSTRKESNQVFYSLRDPLLIEVLDTMRRYFQAHLEEALAMLTQLDRE
jgi:ArsR family transcriptional regulator